MYRNDHGEIRLKSASLLQRHLFYRALASRPPTHPNPTDKAEELCFQFVNRSNIENLTIDTRQRLNVLQSERDAIIYQAVQTKDITDQPFNLSELEHALQRKKNTAPGDDDCTYSMIRQAPTMFKLEYLKLCNLSLRTGRLPKRWKTVKLVPIPKKDGSFRPISLITVLSKVCEKMVLQRLRWNARPVNMYSLGFRSHVGTQDAIATVVSHISKRAVI